MVQLDGLLALQMQVPTEHENEAVTHTHTHTRIHPALQSCMVTRTTIEPCLTARVTVGAILSSCPFPLPRLCCQTMGRASGWESQTPQRSPSPFKHQFPLTNYGWTASDLTALITSGWHVLVARAPHSGPTGFLWRHLREVRS